jgi:protein-tyrosine phosphatase
MGNTSSVPTAAQAATFEKLSDTADAALLAGLDLETVPPRVWELTQIRTLNLSRNHLAALPADVAQLTSLNALFVNSNRLARVPRLSTCHQLTTVNFQSNRLTRFPVALTEVASLTEIELQGNRIRDVPTAIAQLTNLRHLNLNRNELQMMPPEVAIATLVSLNLADNCLEALPHLATPNLRYLVASGNRLVAPPLELAHLTQLDLMQLDRNRLIEFPESYAQLTSVTMLDVRDNCIVRLPSCFHETAPPFVYCDVPSPIVPGLLLGNVSGSQNRAVLSAAGVTHVVRAIDALGQAMPPFPEELNYLSIDCLDTDEQNMRQFFERSNAFIAAARREGGVVLVHCRQGKSRSATLVIAFLMMSQGWSFEEAKTFVKSRRNIAGPNPSFCMQLRLYANELTLH